MLTFIPKVSITPKTITIYNEVVKDNNFKKSRDQYENLKDNKRKSDLSDNSKRRLKYAVEWFIHAVEPDRIINKEKFKQQSKNITFITLTISAKQETKSDYDHNRKCLNQFLTELRQGYQVQNYVWKLEKQKNGNIHYHIITDKKIDHYKLRVMWNRIQNKFGYVDQYQKKHKGLTFEQYCSMYPERKNKKGQHETTEQYKKRMLGAYEFGCKTDWKQPNSTDIHTLYKITDIVSYISKYFSKDSNVKIDTSEPLPRLWGCSQGISKLKSLKLYIEDQSKEFCNELKFLKDNVKLYSGDFFDCICVGFAELVQKGYKEITTMFIEHINGFRIQYNYSPLTLYYE